MAQESILRTMREQYGTRYDRHIKYSATDRSFIADAAMAVVLFVLSLPSMVDLPEIYGVQDVDVLAVMLIATPTPKFAWRRGFAVVVVSVVMVSLASKRPGRFVVPVTRPSRSPEY